MIYKKSKLLVSFLFLLSSNSSFQGIEMVRTCCQAIYKLFVPDKVIPAKEKKFQKSHRRFKSEEIVPILKKRYSRGLNSDKKVTFNDHVEEIY